jgi:hypothetical protein
MANVNTFAGIYNFTQGFTTATETTLQVPAAAGTYPGLPSPTLAAGAGLYIQPSPDITGSELDGHPFRVRISGVVTNGASDSLTVKLYLGTSSTTTSNTAIVGWTQAAATTANYPFIAEATLIWDSTSTKIWGTLDQLFNGVYVAVTTSGVTTTTVSSISGLQFIPSFTFATANASNSILIREFTLERV